MPQLWCLEVANRSPEEMKALSSEEVFVSSRKEKMTKSSKEKKIMESSGEKTGEDAQNVNPPQYLAAPQPRSYSQVPCGVAQLHLAPLPYQQPLPHQPHQYLQQPFPLQQHQPYQSQYQQLPFWTGMQPQSPGALARPELAPSDSGVTTCNQAGEATIHQDEEKDALANTVTENQVCPPVDFETITTHAREMGGLKGWVGEKRKRRREVERERGVEEEVERKRIEEIMERMTSNILNMSKVATPRQDLKHSALGTASISSEGESSCEWESKETVSQSNPLKHKRIRRDDKSSSVEKSAYLRFNKDDTKSVNQARIEGNIATIDAPEVWDMKTIKVPARNIGAHTRTSSPKESEEQIYSSGEDQSSAGLAGAEAGLSALAAACDESSETHSTGRTLSETDGKKNIVAAAAFARRIPDGAKTEIHDGIKTIVPMKTVKRAEAARKSATGKKPVASSLRISTACGKEDPVKAAAFARRLPDYATAEVQDGITTIVPAKRGPMSSTKPPTGKKPDAASVVARAKTKENQTLSQTAASTVCRKDPVEAVIASSRNLPHHVAAEVQEDGITTIVPAGARAKTKENQKVSRTAASIQAVPPQTWGQPAVNPVDCHRQMMQGQVMAPGHAMPCGIAQSQYGFPQSYAYHQPPVIAVHNTAMQPAMQMHLGMQQIVNPVPGAPASCVAIPYPHQYYQR